ncbi:hypothetical protein [Ligilactobacillus salivarius]|uniref:hypothetical protein n=1 Tax=Ligilactobacillus salivarius TaxID=1624 RepID=UPI00237DD6AB|nr:hypothetical protein [Ligilactobacillus salivarius]MDE1525066.1 hypothetical protein [Ligilactobacillus salivarius]
MEIEYKNKNYGKDIYRVGNVISRLGTPILVAKTSDDMYCFVDLSNGKIFTPKCASLEILFKNYSFISDVLVKAKLIVDYELVGAAEDEDTK